MRCLVEISESYTSHWFLPKSESESHSVSPWNSLGQNTGMGSCSLLQGVFPTQGSNTGLPHCRQILYQLSHQEVKVKLLSRVRIRLCNPMDYSILGSSFHGIFQTGVLEWVAIFFWVNYKSLSSSISNWYPGISLFYTNILKNLQLLGTSAPSAPPSLLSLPPHDLQLLAPSSQFFPFAFTFLKINLF